MVSSPVRDLLGVISLLVLSNGPLFFVSRNILDLPGAWEGPFIRPVIIATVLAGVVVVMLDPFRPSGRRMQRPPRLVFAAAVGLGAWASLSTLWSVQSEVTLWRSLLYMALPFLGWIFADLEFSRFLRAITAALALLVVSSLLLVVVWSSVALDRNDDWRGIFTNRNGFAPICALAVIIGVARFLAGSRWSGVLLATAATVGLLGSGSRTAWFALAVALGSATLLVIARAAYQRAPSRRLAVGAGAGAVVGGAVTILAVVGLWNESTFTQRRTIWDLLGDHIADQPIRGLGFQAFWSVPELIGEHDLLRRGSAHGSVPELLLGVGMVGLVLWLVVVLVALAGSLRNAWAKPSASSFTWLALTVFLVAENLTESFVLWFSYNWVLLIAIAIRFGGRGPASPSVRTPQPTSVATG